MRAGDELHELMKLSNLKPYQRWVDLHFVSGVLAAMSIVLVEISALLLLTFNGSLRTPFDVYQYLNSFLFQPAMLLFIVLAITYLIRWNWDTREAQTLSCSLMGIIIVFIIYNVHWQLKSIDMALTIPIIITVGYVSIRLTSATALCVIAGKMISDTFLIPQLPTTRSVFSGNEHAVLDFSVSLIILIITWMICIIFIYAEKAKEDDMDRYERTQARLYYRTITDVLTGVGNRLAMRHALDAARSEQIPFCVIAMIDMDHFKNINDTHGHEVGDRYIVETAHLLAKVDHAQTFRFGGDEFCLLFTNRTMAQVADRCKLLELEMKSLDVCLEVEPMSLSIGLSLWNTDSEPAEAIRRADTALYKAKETRGIVKIYDQDMGLRSPNATSLRRLGHPGETTVRRR